jgi:hypothetical protein
MIKVLMIPGSDFDVRQFLDLVRRRCGVLYVSADSGAVCADETTQLLILEMRSVGSPCDFGADIVVVGNGAPDISHLPNGCIKKGATVIFDPQDVYHCRFMADPALRPVTCGAGERNTVSISSIGDEALVLSVGRDVRNVYGGLVEVQDYVFHGKVWDVPSAVLACALLLLTEERDMV